MSNSKNATQKTPKNNTTASCCGTRTCQNCSCGCSKDACTCQTRNCQCGCRGAARRK